MSEMAQELRTWSQPQAACDTCNGAGYVAQEGQIGVPGSGCLLTCPDCGPTPSVEVDPDFLPDELQYDVTS